MHRNSCSARPRRRRGALTTISTIENEGAGSGPAPPAALLRTEPDRNCPLCPRLLEFREAARARAPEWFNSPVPSFGDPDARLLIVGLAPGLQGANRTGRPFTGDFAGDLLYATLIEYGFAAGVYQARSDDGLMLIDCRISNAVRCVPPQNKPLPAEINTCRQFLSATINSMPSLRALVLLGRVAHESTLKAVGIRASAAPFGHGAVHQAGALKLYDSYHCSRYNTNTRVLTPEMFRSVFAKVRADLG
jgi:uracil-DNA glycosylase family 4